MLEYVWNMYAYLCAHTDIHTYKRLLKFNWVTFESYMCRSYQFLNKLRNEESFLLKDFHD